MYFFPPALLAVLSRTGPDSTGSCGMHKETPDGFSDAQEPFSLLLPCQRTVTFTSMFYQFLCSWFPL